MERYPFDPRNPLYKTPFGAVAEHTVTTLRVLLHFDARVHTVWLRCRNDADGSVSETPMHPGDSLDDYRFYTATLSLAEGLYWYDFHYTSDYGDFCIARFEHDLGVVSAEANPWQLTVFQRDFSTPDWVKGGVMYQIFPDRFFAGNNPLGGRHTDRFYVSDTSKTPLYTQTETVATLGNDYYGGNLNGITEKLPYLADLGVTLLYLNPIFEAHSNHRYNTADYTRVDEDLGSCRDLERLCQTARTYGISVLLDGVFSHTGDDSLYFNKQGRYPVVGAYQSPRSPYASWYHFDGFPDDYRSWWGVPTLPETNEEDPSFDAFINGENGIARRWIKAGIAGWRLDVADELPDSFLDHFRTAVKSEDPDAFILGEVWEDATDKISHGGRRRYLRGRQLDSVMNYPFYRAVLTFLQGGNGRDFIDTVLTVMDHYPAASLHCLMNHMGTHDTPRLLTQLAVGPVSETDRETLAGVTLTTDQLARAKQLQRLAAVLQYTLPGIPCLYYGDEAGMTGFGDPFCRSFFPWGKEDRAITALYRTLGHLRRQHTCFADGALVPIEAQYGHVAYLRQNASDRVLIAVNRWYDAVTLSVPPAFDNAQVILGETSKSGQLTIPPIGAVILAV